MDNQALAEQMTDLYLSINDYYEKKTASRPVTEQVNTIFIECSKMIMTETIGKQRSGVPSQQKPTADEKPTEKQMSFAAKLGCKNASEYTKQGLSLWIEEHKTY